MDVVEGICLLCMFIQAASWKQRQLEHFFLTPLYQASILTELPTPITKTLKLPNQKYDSLQSIKFNFPTKQSDNYALPFRPAVTRIFG